MEALYERSQGLVIFHGTLYENHHFKLFFYGISTIWASEAEQTGVERDYGGALIKQKAQEAYITVSLPW